MTFYTTEENSTAVLLQYSGQFRSGRRDGFGVLYYYYHEGNDGRRLRPEYEGGFLNGSLHGEGSIFARSGQVLLQGVFQHGEFVSGRVRDEKGTLIYEGTLK